MVTVLKCNARPQAPDESSYTKAKPMGEGLKIFWPLLWICVSSFLVGVLWKSFEEQKPAAVITGEAVQKMQRSGCAACTGDLLMSLDADFLCR